MHITVMRIERGGRRPPLPVRKTARSAGFDIAAFLDEPVVVRPGERALIPTGIALDLGEGRMGLVFARSGLAVNHGIALANGVGLIDSDYRGELKIGLINNSEKAVTIEDGMRIAQLVVAETLHLEEIREAEILDDTARGSGGFGSTGIK